MTCELIGPVDVSRMIAWIQNIPPEAWPQQHRLADGKLRPAMITDPKWQGFSKMIDWVVGQLEVLSQTYQHMLSVVIPGHSIDPHVDTQADYWKYRVHVPLITSPLCKFIIGGVEHNLAVGKAYRVNTREMHSVVNGGLVPRIHFMFDVRE